MSNVLANEQHFSAFREELNELLMKWAMATGPYMCPLHGKDVDAECECELDMFVPAPNAMVAGWVLLMSWVDMNPDPTEPAGDWVTNVNSGQTRATSLGLIELASDEYRR